MKNEIKRIYTVNQFAEEIGVTPFTIRHWDKSSKLNSKQKHKLNKLKEDIRHD